MHELKKNGKVFTSKFVGTGPSSYEKRIYRAAVSQRLRNTALEGCYFAALVLVESQSLSFVPLAHGNLCVITGFRLCKVRFSVPRRGL